MVTHTRNWSSAFNPSKCTHTAVSSEHTHCEHAPRAVGSHCSSARGAVGGSVPCSRSPQSWYWGWRECCSFTIPTFNPCRTWDSNPQPLDYKSDSLTIRPQLPPIRPRLPRAWLLLQVCLCYLRLVLCSRVTYDCVPVCMDGCVWCYRCEWVWRSAAVSRTGVCELSGIISLRVMQTWI